MGTIQLPNIIANQGLAIVADNFFEVAGNERQQQPMAIGAHLLQRAFMGFRQNMTQD
jgi:hypothetical protein